MSKTEAYVRQACVEVTGGGSQPTCPSNTVAIGSIPIPITGLTVKIPVVLSEVSVQVNVDSIITLPEPALEIKKIKKRLKITQCLLVQDPADLTPTSSTLFLKGFVRKNIDYATHACSTNEGVCGDIRHCTIDVPFTCTTTIPFSGALPVVPTENTRSEFEYFRRQKLPRGAGFAEKDELLSGDFSEFNQVSEEFFTELPFCELIQARIVEYDEFLNRTPHHVTIPIEAKEFTQIEEKMIISVIFKVLQNQQVPILPPVTP